jgi:antirestriction protein
MLYNCQIEGNVLRFSNQEKSAIDLAISLAGVDLPLAEGADCLLPFPKHERECKSDNVPQLYVACLSAYNNGFLHGMWIDATQEYDSIREDIEWMLSWSPCREYEACEEWAIHDFQNWHDIHIDEHEDLERLAELAQTLSEHGKAFAVYYSYYGSDASNKDFHSSYYGEYESEEDFVYEQWEEQGQIKKLEELGISTSYINWEAIATDWFIDSYLSIDISYNKVFVFSRH